MGSGLSGDGRQLNKGDCHPKACKNLRIDIIASGGFCYTFFEGIIYSLCCDKIYVKIFLGAAVAIGGGFAFQCMSTYRLPRILGVMPMRKVPGMDSKYCWILLVSLSP